VLGGEVIWDFDSRGSTGNASESVIKLLMFKEKKVMDILERKRY